jgi:hypothetical protein
LPAKGTGSRSSILESSVLQTDNPLYAFVLSVDEDPELNARWQPFALSPTITFGEIELGEPQTMTVNIPVEQIENSAFLQTYI